MPSLLSRRKATQRRALKKQRVRRRRLKMLRAAVVKAAKNIAARRRLIRKAEAPKPGQLTPNFHIREFDTHDGTKVPAYMESHLRDLCQRVLEPLRAEFGPCRVTSGYRHQAYNARIGGASQSYHVYELRRSQPAADVTFARGTVAQWAAAARRHLGGTGGVGTYIRSGFVHVDTRNNRSDWSG